MVTPEVGISASPFKFMPSRLGIFDRPQRRTAWFSTIAAFLLLLANLAVNVGFNRWNRWISMRWSRRMAGHCSPPQSRLSASSRSARRLRCSSSAARMTLQVKWRQWLTGEALARWLSEQRYYQLRSPTKSRSTPNTASRTICAMASEPIVEFALGFVNALLTAVTFVGILFWVGGSLQVNVFNKLVDTGLHRHRRGDIRRRRVVASLFSLASRWSTELRTERR